MRHVKQPIRAPKSRLESMMANKPKEIGTGLNGSIMAIGLKIHVTAVASPILDNSVTVELELPIFVSGNHILNTFTGT